MSIVIADLYGLGGLVTSPGMRTLAAKIKSLGKGFLVLGPYDQGDWQQAADDLDNRPKSDLIGAVGYSLGANNVIEIAARTASSFLSLASSRPIGVCESIGRAASRCRPTSERHSVSTTRFSPLLSGWATRDTRRRPRSPARSRSSLPAICIRTPTMTQAFTA